MYFFIIIDFVLYVHYIKMKELNFIDLEKDWRWRRAPIFLSDFAGQYLQETNKESSINDINNFLDSFCSIKGSIINNLNKDDAEESLQKLDKRIAAAREIIHDIEKIPEEVLQIVSDLYSPGEIPFDLDSCIYSNWTFRVKTTKDFRHHIKSNPGYWTAINIQFAFNQVAYLIGWVEYNAIGRLKEFLEKSKGYDFLIHETKSRLVKYAPKNDDYYIEWSILNTKTLAKPEWKNVFTTMVFKLINTKWEVFNYNQMTLCDKNWPIFSNMKDQLSNK